MEGWVGPDVWSVGGRDGVEYLEPLGDKEIDGPGAYRVRVDGTVVSKTQGLVL